MRLSRRSLRFVVALTLISLAFGPISGVANTSRTRLAPKTTPSLFDTYIKPALAWWTQDDTPVARGGSSSTVDKLFLCPTALTMYEGEDRLLSPVPVDADGATLYGVEFTWTSTNSGVADVQDAGRLIALAAGHTTVTAWADGVNADVSVTVLAGERPENSNEPSEPCTNDLPENVVPPPDQECTVPPESAFPPLDGGDSDSSISVEVEAYDNAVGTPRNFPVETSVGGMTPTPNNNALGSSSYQFTAPISSLGGREIGVNLGLAYNSQLWTNDANQLHFNYDKGWPAAGWRLGFGRIIENVGGSNNYLLITPDGTRIVCAVDTSNPTRWTHLATDGSYIRLKKNGTVIRAYYPDGTEMRFVNTSQTNSRWLPVEVKTRNGNFFSIAYRAYDATDFPSRWAISTITDTLGRIYRFGYRSASINGGSCILQLHYIKGPAPDGTEKYLVLLDYDKITVHPNFSSPLTIVQGPSNNQDSDLVVVRRIAFPLTGRGYVFSNFSPYGMAKTISVRRAMVTGLNGNNLDFPDVSDGTEIASTTYTYNDVNFQGQPAVLSDIPQFTARAEKVYDQNGLNPQTFTYTYSRTVTPTITSIVMPPASLGMATMVTTVDSATGYTDLVEYKDGGTVLRAIDYQYAGSQVSKVLTTDQGLTSEVRYSYSTYDRLTKVREYSFEGTLVRTTTTGYKDGSNYLDRNLLYLVKDIQTYANGDETNGTLVAKTEFDYDNYVLTTYGSTPTVHGYDSSYTNQTNRGNLTQIRLYPDPFDIGTSILRTMQYDKFGNLLTADLSCCQKRTITFNATLDYSQPVSIASGQTGGPVLTTTLFYTSAGAIDTVTAPTGQTTKYTYDATWRPVEEVFKRTGGTSDDVKTTYTYGTAVGAGYANDAQTFTSATQYKESYADSAFTRTITSKTDFDGAGRSVRSGVARSAGFDYVSTSFDGAHRVTAQSNPYVNTASQWTQYSYDKLSRLIQVTAPGGDTGLTAYGNSANPSLRTVTSTDPVSRKQTNSYDALGRLANVVEDPDGYGYVTSYSYDALDNLILVNQGGQYRRYAYDALSRMRYEQVPEQTPSSALNYLGINWTAKFDYNDFNQLIDHTDARGVVTHYTYDGLNRLTQISYNSVSGVESADGPVTIAYNNNPGQSKHGQVSSVSNGIASETYTYDAFSRVQQMTTVIDGKTFTPSEYFYTTAGDSRGMKYPGYGTTTKQLNITHDTRGRANGLKQGTWNSASQTFSPSGTYVSNVVYGNPNSPDAAPPLLPSAMVLGNSLNEVYNYNSRLQMSQQKVTNSSGSNTLMQMQYDYTDADNKNSGQLQEVATSGSGIGQAVEQYTYDPLARLSIARKTVGSAPSAGPTTIGVYQTTSGAFFLRNSNSNGPADQTFFFGAGSVGNIAIAGDWDGNGTDTVGLYNRSSGVFLVNVDGQPNADITFNFGLVNNQNWQPIAGNWDKKNGDSIGLYDPTAGVFYLRDTNSNGNADTTFYYGPQSSTWLAIAGDWDGDGRDTVGLYDPSTSTFYLKNSNNPGNADLIIQYGSPNLLPVVGDWDGNGTDTIGLYNPAIGSWQLKNSNTGGAADLTFFFASGGNPIAGDWDGTPQNGSNWQQTYSYDRWGNRTKLIHQANGALSSQDVTITSGSNGSTNRIATVNNVAQVYDAAGNLTSDGVYDYKYDGANRLRRILLAGTSTLVAQYWYDAANRRVKQIVNGVTTHSLWEGMHAIAEFTVTGSTPTLAAHYIFLGSRMVAVEQAGSTTKYTHPDRLSTRILTSTSGAVVGTQSHRPFGEEDVVTGVTDKHRFTNYERDGVGSDYAMNRQYSGNIGRFNVSQR